MISAQPRSCRKRQGPNFHTTAQFFRTTAQFPEPTGSKFTRDRAVFSHRRAVPGTDRNQISAWPRSFSHSRAVCSHNRAIPGTNRGQISARPAPNFLATAQFSAQPHSFTAAAQFPEPTGPNFRATAQFSARPHCSEHIFPHRRAVFRTAAQFPRTAAQSPEPTGAKFARDRNQICAPPRSCWHGRTVYRTLFAQPRTFPAQSRNSRNQQDQNFSATGDKFSRDRAVFRPSTQFPAQSRNSRTRQGPNFRAAAKFFRAIAQFPGATGGGGWGGGGRIFAETGKICARSPSFPARPLSYIALKGRDSRRLKRIFPPIELNLDRHATESTFNDTRDNPRKDNSYPIIGGYLRIIRYYPCFTKN